MSETGMVCKNLLHSSETSKEMNAKMNHRVH